eukprot:scaffold57836_cov46-Prasinocladus_malaysianus.AAC.1
MVSDIGRFCKKERRVDILCAFLSIQLCWRPGGSQAPGDCRQQWLKGCHEVQQPDWPLEWA